MSTNKNIDKVKKFSDLALERISKDALAPTPETYDLWYNYYSGGNIEIGRAIDVLEKKNPKITQAQCDELYSRHLSDTKLRQMTEKSEKIVMSVMNDILSIMGEVQGATGEFGGTLQGANQDLAQVKSVDDLKKVMTEVFSDTKKMAEKNQVLEAQLGESSSRMQQLKGEVEQARKEASTDGLTGLTNRKAFDETFDLEIQTAQEGKHALSLLVIDIDHFKSFNDTFGHQVGDQVLRLVARTMIENIKGRDTAARYGGEEFVVILPETNLTGAVAAANMLRKTIQNKDLVNKSTGESLGQITVSIGAAELIPAETATEIIERADTALYAAKQGGRNQVSAAPRPDIHELNS